jgi:hypothetical protein
VPAGLCRAGSIDLSRSDQSRAEPKDLILGIVDYYDFHEIRPFLVTLRHTDFAGHICLFAGPAISAGTERKIRDCAVQVVRYGREFPFIAEPHPALPVVRFEPRHIYNFRHYLYLDYLLKRGERFRNVLVTDVRDVVFQRDPFGFPVADCIHVAMENPDIPIGACPWTSSWIKEAYPVDVLERLSDEELSCAGTTVAPVALMKRYLRLMIEELATMKYAHEHADQPAHNVLLHSGKLDPLVKLSNFAGPILTVGSEPHYLFNEQGLLVNRDGSAVALIHQYDRHPELRRLFERKALPSTWRRVALNTMHRWKGRARRLKAKLKGAR